MTLDDLPTPCLVLDARVLRRNLARMAERVARHGVTLRPHMKTAKSLDVAALAAPGFGPITVSTLAEAAHFARGGYGDQIYAVGITPQKLDALAAINAGGARAKAITDDPEAARAIAAHPGVVSALVELDVGEGRGGVAADDPRLPLLAATLGPRFAGLLAHSGHSYAGRSADEMAAIAERERADLVAAASLLRARGHAVPIVSAGSSPTALHARSLDGVTETRPGVYMFGDLFQAGIGTHGLEDIAVTVLASVTGRKPGGVLLDAGGLALSKDRSTEAGPRDWAFGRVLGLDGRPLPGEPVVARAYQEHGVVPGLDAPVGTRFRIAPNHVCMTAAAHGRYHVVEGGREVVALWERVNGW